MQKIPLKSKNGCQRCRERRKKCNEIKPVCGECSRLGFKCRWQTATEAERRLSSRHDQRTWTLEISNQSFADMYTQCTTASGRQTQNADYRDVRPFDHPAILQAGATAILRDANGRHVFQYLWERGDSLLRYPTQRDANYKSINGLRSGMAIALKGPIPIETYLCVGAGHLANLDPRYKMEALAYYNRVVTSFRLALERYRHEHGPPAEWTVAVAALLAWNEMVVFTSPQDRLAHLIGFYRLVEARVTWQAPWGPTRTLLEQYVHSFSLNSLFHYEVVVGQRSVHYMDDMMTSLNAAPRPLGREVIGVPEDLTIVVYKLAFLNFQDISQSPWDFELQATLAKLESWQPREYASTPSDKTLLLIGRMYYLACVCFMQHMQSRNGDADDELISTCVEEAAMLIQQSDMRTWPPNSIVYPLVILTMFSATPLQRLVFKQPLETLATTTKLHGYLATLTFLSRIAEEALGPTVLQRRDLLDLVQL